jgi:hypothetical protein
MLALTLVRGGPYDKHDLVPVSWLCAALFSCFLCFIAERRRRSTETFRTRILLVSDHESARIFGKTEQGRPARYETWWFPLSKYHGIPSPLQVYKRSSAVRWLLEKRREKSNAGGSHHWMLR